MGEEFDPKIRQTDPGIFTTPDAVIWDGEAHEAGYEPLTDVPADVWSNIDTDDDDDPNAIAAELNPDKQAEIAALLDFDPFDDDAAPYAWVRAVHDALGPRGPAIRSDRASAPGLAAIPEQQSAHAAGLLLMSGDRMLLVKHGERGTWEFPGGMIEDGESAEEAALRETREEIGAAPHGKISLLTRQTSDGVDFTTFLARAAQPFEPDLSQTDGELVDWVWAARGELPEPLHPGAARAIERIGMHELDIARQIASGAFPSPQQYENVWLFALRITGTGASYRPELKEYVWRDPALYLNDEFLARCNGLPVIIEHPPIEELNTEEYTNRVIGAIVLPFIEGDEVWGIAKIYDQRAAEVMRTHPLSTSPSVIFRDPGVNQTRPLASGEHLLIEGEPSLLDHLAICGSGVWDKGGPPTGIAVGSPQQAEADLPQ